MYWQHIGRALQLIAVSIDSYFYWLIRIARNFRAGGQYRFRLFFGPPIPSFSSIDLPKSCPPLVFGPIIGKADINNHYVGLRAPVLTACFVFNLKP
ncbi:hypothetical protein A3224_14230 [Microbulbifer thermotolerans]|uniref:Uncharacterized protein n=1 Tax=Microbulbifer thermotolerans TaxID=252514 RepID=A0A143HQ82_MICTH|nr:hypothetical protein A3224_14230 [Microbulbifer thermotolerans]